MKSLGVIETRGMTSAIQAADAACKTASVEIIGYRKIGSGLVSVCFQGEISAVRTAVDHGCAVITNKELLVGSLVIARPEENVITKLLTVKSNKNELIKSFEQAEKIEPAKEIKETKLDNVSQSLIDENRLNIAVGTVAKEIKSEQRKGKKS